MFQVFFINLITFLFKLFKGLLNVDCIPDHYDICQQIKAPGCDLLFFFLLLAGDPVTSEPKVSPQVMELLPFINLGIDAVPERQAVRKNKYFYLDRELQPETEWLDLNARFYDPTIGRFLTVDPLASEGSWVSPYNFVQNDPISRIDPTGALDREYESEAAYRKENPNGNLDGSDGHWLTSDRTNNTGIWDEANRINLQENRSGDYTSVSQRRDFYGWYAGKIDVKGFDNNWPSAAYVVAGQMSNLDNPLVA